MGERDQKQPLASSFGEQGSANTLQVHGLQVSSGTLLTYQMQSSLPPNLWPHNFLALSVPLTVFFIVLTNVIVLPFAITALILSVMVSGNLQTDHTMMCLSPYPSTE